jgi:hypothetical protein
MRPRSPRLSWPAAAVGQKRHNERRWRARRGRAAHNGRHLRRVLAEYTVHYNARQPHQSLDQRHPDADTAIPAPVIDLTGRRIKRRPILGGLINEYEAA